MPLQVQRRRRAPSEGERRSQVPFPRARKEAVSSCKTAFFFLETVYYFSFSRRHWVTLKDEPTRTAGAFCVTLSQPARRGGGYAPRGLLPPHWALAESPTTDAVSHAAPTLRRTTSQPLPNLGGSGSVKGKLSDRRVPTAD
ncbi:hypothetical protein IscW_ISCW000626 [Ixodes scapularis]|uniref:Uncharacterized protein n=1 Tax=Ixodes scapularis TaxID=6945 RepID=B7P7D5_IXOSC|nr:hypothetical protein IscW_ISCW000626 [Ixodes scapularis]|eukprot:XP_002410046.1 hypothetical protein IscW_ISCW000626 [Ixodes scapularis]